MSGAEKLVIPEYEPRKTGDFYLFQAPKKESWNSFSGMSSRLKEALSNMQIDHSSERVFLVSNLNKDHTNQNFDPIRIDINPLGEDYNLFDKATSRFGLQVEYWERLAKQLHFGILRPSRALNFSIVPVFRFDGNDYLIIKDRGQGEALWSYNYFGDYDAVVAAREGKWGLKSGIDILGSEMGLDNSFFSKYVKHREEISQVKKRNQEKALKKYLNGNDFKQLKKYFTFMDKIRKAIINKGNFLIFSTVQEVIEKTINKGIEEGGIVNRKDTGKLVEGVDILIMNGLLEVYDECLAEEGYAGVIGKLSELMNSYYPKVIAATG